MCLKYDSLPCHLRLAQKSICVYSTVACWVKNKGKNSWVDNFILVFI